MTRTCRELCSIKVYDIYVLFFFFEKLGMSSQFDCLARFDDMERSYLELYVGDIFRNVSVSSLKFFVFYLCTV